MTQIEKLRQRVEQMQAKAKIAYDKDPFGKEYVKLQHQILDVLQKVWALEK